MADEIVKVPDVGDPEWTEIVERLIEEMGEELPDKVVQATELLLCGWPTYQVAKKVGTSAKTVREWLAKYPAMAMAVKNGRQLLTSWRMSKLEQQFVLAAEKSKEVLELSLRDETVDSRLTGIVAQHARFVMGLFMGQKIDIDIKVNETPQMKARQDALGYIAGLIQKTNQQPENVIDATYTVVPVEKQEAGQPLMDEHGNPLHGKLGELDTNAEGTLCHICGNRSLHPVQHVVSHRVSIADYCLIFMIPEQELKSLGRKSA